MNGATPPSVRIARFRGRSDVDGEVCNGCGMTAETCLARLRIFAKGNLDVRDSLHSLRVGGELLWNGINEIVRVRHPGTVVQVLHETMTRSDALLEARGEVPADLAQRTLDLGAYPAAAQFSTALFEARADAIVLSIQPDVAMTLARHKRDGYLFHPWDWASWPEDDRRWLRQNFHPVPLLDADASMRNLERVVARIRERSAVPIVLYNVSAIVPGDSTHAYQGLDETLATRIRRFDLAVIDLSRRIGLSVVDVDAIVARAGADRVKLDVFHLDAEGCRLVANQTVRVLEDLGVFPATAA